MILKNLIRHPRIFYIEPVEMKNSWQSVCCTTKLYFDKKRFPRRKLLNDVSFQNITLSVLNLI